MIPVVIPAKPLTRALGRLAGVIDQATRRALQAAMLTDVLEAATGYSDHVIVVTADRVVADLAEAAAAGVVADADPPEGINHAVSRGIAATGAAAVLIVMGDIPGVTADELRRVATAADADRAITIGMSGDGTGTNAMLLRPAGVIAPSFGAGSLLRHRAAARAADCECAIVSAPGLALDIDTPEDLAAFVRTAGRPSHTRELCTALGLYATPPLSPAG